MTGEPRAAARRPAGARREPRTRARSHGAGAAFVLVPLLACDASTGPGGPAVELTVTRSVFELPADEPAIVTFDLVNRGGSTAYVSACGDRVMTGIDREDRGGWMHYAGDACPAVYPMAPIAIAPGETFRSARSIGRPGRYRLRVGVSASPAGRVQWAITSNAFTVQ